MATHDYIISNASGAAVRADLNNALAAIVSNNSNATSPATTYAFQWWADTTTGQLKLRNAANSAWITIFELDGTMLMEDGTESAPGLAFASDLNTGFFRPSADHLYISAGGANRVAISTSAVVINEPSNDVDFRVESNGNTHMLFVDAGNDRVGIGDSAPDFDLVIKGGSNTNENLFACKDSDGTKMVSVEQDSSGHGRLLVFDTSGNNDVLLHSNGNSFFNGGDIGIGTSSPGHLLDLSNSSDAYIRQTRGSSTFRVGPAGDQASDGVILGTDTNGPLRIFTNGSSNERARIDTSGRLLVGASTSPSAGDGQYAKLASIGNTLSASGDGRILLGRGAAATSLSADQNIGSVLFTDNTGLTFAAVGADVDGTTGSGDYPARLFFSTTADGASSPTERCRIDQQGRLLINHTASVAPDGYESKLQLCDTSYQGSSIVLRRDQNNTSGGTLIFAKSRATSKGGNGIVSDADDCGSIRWYANDGADQDNELARIRAIVNGTPGSNDTPGALTFWTTSDGSNTPTERMRILTDGTIRLTSGCPGIDFSQVQTNASGMTSETLDSYEEGTWTATLNPSGGFTPTSNTTTGYYTKIGRQVTVVTNAIMTIPSSLGTYVNNSTSFGLGVSGLPFTIANAGSQGRSAPVIGVADNIGFSGGTLTGHGSNNTTQCSIFVNKDNGAVRSSPTLTASQSINFHFCFTYFI